MLPGARRVLRWVDEQGFQLTHVRTSVVPALPQLKHAASAAADLVAAHGALDGPGLSIEGARTYAHGIITGAVAVFVRFSAPGRPAAVSVPRTTNLYGRIDH